MKLSGFHVLDISFTDAKHGFALGAFEQPRMAVLRTSDGGRTWKTVTTPPEAVKHIEFTTPKLGWVFGPNLFVTRDGGATWTPQQAGGKVWRILPSGRSVWAVILRCGVSGTCRRGLRISTDGGDAWRTPALPARVRGDTVSAARMGSTGYLVGSGGLARRHPILRTLDGGATWEAIKNPCDRPLHPGYLLGEAVVPNFDIFVLAVDARMAWLNCTDEPAASQRDVTAFVSFDAGSTWRRGGPSGSDPVVVSIVGRHRALSLDGVAEGLFSSRGVGDSSRFGRYRMWRDAQLVDRRHGYAAEGPNVWRTVDGGRHWEAVRLKPTGCG